MDTQARGLGFTFESVAFPAMIRAFESRWNVVRCGCHSCCSKIGRPVTHEAMESPVAERHSPIQFFYGKISSFASEPLAESGLIHTLTFAGSTANWLRSFQIANVSGPSLNVTFFVSPGANAIR